MNTELLQFKPYINLSEKLPDEIEPTQVVVRENEIEYVYRFEAYFGSGRILFSATWNMDLEKFIFSVDHESFLPRRDLQTDFLTGSEFTSELQDVFQKGTYTIQ
jgi:hypothetical protein